MTLEYESQHVGDDMRTHKHSATKGPALDHQDAEWGLQVGLLRQVLGWGEGNWVSEGLRARERQQQRQTNNAAKSAFSAQLHHSLTVSCLVSD